MKKMDFLGGPPPPPPPTVIPLPPQESQLYSPTQYSGVYSPSRATSPHSDEEAESKREAPASTTSTSSQPLEPALKPGKVLGSDQAKKRLQAFARCRTAPGPKGKVAQVFQEDEEAETKEREDQVKKKLAAATNLKEPSSVAANICSSTPVMASIMKEETENRELVKRSMETLARKNEEEEERKKEKASSDNKRIPFEDQEDLRDILMKKRGESGRGRSEKSIKRERKSRSPRSRSRSRSGRKNSRSCRRSRSRSRSRQPSRRNGNWKRSRSISSTSSRKGSISSRRSRSRTRRNSRDGKERRIKEESRSPLKRDTRRSSSRRGRIERRLETSEERDARRGGVGRSRVRGSPLTRRGRESVSPGRSRSRTKEMAAKADLRKRSRSRRKGRSSSGGSQSPAGDRSSSHGGREVRNPNDGEDQSRRDHENNRNDRSPESGQRKKRPRAEILDLGDSQVSSTVKEKAVGDEVVMVKAASDEDYFAVKQETRPPLLGAGTVDGDLVPFLAKYVRVTSCGGVKWSMNKMSNEAADPVLQRSLEIRKSVESAVLDLEQEVIRKQSRERSSSEMEEKSSSSKKKKKKKQKSAKDAKKERNSTKKKQHLDKSSSSSSSSKKKKKKKSSKENDADLSSEVPQGSPELKAMHRPRSQSKSSPTSQSAPKLFSTGLYAEDGHRLDDSMVSRSLSPSPIKASKATGLNDHGWEESEHVGVPKRASPILEAARRSTKSGRRSLSPVLNRAIARKLDEGEGEGRERYPREEFSPMAHTPPEAACWGPEEGGGSPPRSRSPSPSLLADLSRISSGPRSPSPGPRLPKFKDSRSPSKVPIMRDRRSPIRDDGGSGSKRNSPRKKGSKRSRRAHESPRGFSDSPGRYHQDLLYPADLEPEERLKESGAERYHSPRRGPRSPPPEGHDMKYSPQHNTSLSPSPAGKSHPRPCSRPSTPPGSPYRRPASPSRKETSGNYSSPRGPRSPYSPRRQRSPLPPSQRSFSPNGREAEYSTSRARSPLRGARSPDRRGPYSSQARTYSPRSPGRRHSRSPPGRRQTPRSPENRRPPSPRMRRQRTPDRRPNSPRGYSPRGRSPYRNDRSPRRGYSPSTGRGGPRRPYTPPMSPRGPRSPDRRRYSPDRRYSPGRRRYTPDRELRNLPDSTISDAELARQMPPPSHRHLGRLPGLNSPQLGQQYGASPKRLSLDERLEREHGIKVDPEPQMNLHGPALSHHGTPMDFSRPPPGFPGGPPGPSPYGSSGGGHAQVGQGAHDVQVGTSHRGAGEENVRASVSFPTHNSGGVLKAIQPHTSAPVPTSGSLPATIPTYDDSSPAKSAAPAGSRAQVEKEAATLAAQAVASKLQEMQLAKEEERRKRKEQKMAERLAAQLTEVPVEENKKEEVKTGTGRILDMVEKQEQNKEEAEDDTDTGGLKKKDVNARGGRRKKRERDANSPLLITLKPFYRPNEKNGKRKRAAKEMDFEEPEEDFVPRSPVPLPDSAGLKPVLVKPHLTGMKLPGLNSTEKKSKGVKYADGVLPGQGSPDHNQAVPAPPQPPSTPPPKKKYKKAILMVYETHEGDTESDDDESPPPPPPGSPPRYRMAQLIEMFGKPRPVPVQA